MPGKFFLGIDGGQSSTIALIGEESGQVIGKGVAGPCNHVSAAEARAKLLRVLGGCVEMACKQAGIDLDTEFRAACVGMSGGPNDKRDVIREAIRSESLLVTDDAVIAQSGAMAGGPGVITIAGTGSIAFGRSSIGTTARAGGWGYIFGDEGGAFDIVRQALRAALRQTEGWGSATGLSEMFRRETGEPDINTVLHLFYTPEWPRSRVAGLALRVDTAARDGDVLAQKILRNAGQQLASLTAAVRHQLWPDNQSVKAAYIGGAFSSQMLLEGFLEAAEQEGCDVGVPVLSPASGALLEAYHMVGLFPDARKLVTSDF